MVTAVFSVFPDCTTDATLYDRIRTVSSLVTAEVLLSQGHAMSYCYTRTGRLSTAVIVQSLLRSYCTDVILYYSSCGYQVLSLDGTASLSLRKLEGHPDSSEGSLLR